VRASQPSPSGWRALLEPCQLPQGEGAKEEEKKKKRKKKKKKINKKNYLKFVLYGRCWLASTLMPTSQK